MVYFSTAGGISWCLFIDFVLFKFEACFRFSMHNFACLFLCHFSRDFDIPRGRFSFNHIEGVSETIPMLCLKTILSLLRLVSLAQRSIRKSRERMRQHPIPSEILTANCMQVYMQIIMQIKHVLMHQYLKKNNRASNEKPYFRNIEILGCDFDYQTTRRKVHYENRKSKRTSRKRSI
jgi:hypothetical protein